VEHKSLLINHRLESWVFANAAARNAPGSYVAGDIGRIGYQTDSGQYWRLTATTPAWVIIAPAVYATYQGSPTSPAGTAGAYPGIMMGLPGTITPSASGKMLFSLTATGSDTSANVGGQVNLRYGTGTKPVIGQVAQGTAPGALVSYTVPTAGGSVPVSVSAIVTGMTIGTAYWLDVSLNATGGVGTASLLNAALTATEIP
jgi:hypothetical protein